MEVLREQTNSLIYHNQAFATAWQDDVDLVIQEGLVAIPGKLVRKVILVLPFENAQFYFVELGLLFLSYILFETERDGCLYRPLKRAANNSVQGNRIEQKEEILPLVESLHGQGAVLLPLNDPSLVPVSFSVPSEQKAVLVESP